MSLMKIETHTIEIQKMGCMIKNGSDKNRNTQKQNIEKNIFLVRDQRGVRLLWQEAPFSYQGDFFSPITLGKCPCII